MRDDIRNVTDASVADRVAAILASSANQPGLNEMISLMNLAAEANHVQQMCLEMSPSPALTLTADL